MKIFELFKKDYKDLTEEDKMELEKLEKVVYVGGGLIIGLAVGGSLGSYMQSKKNTKMLTQTHIDGFKLGYDIGWEESGKNMLEGIHKYNPESFADIMKTAQDKGFKHLYDVGMTVLN